MANLFFMVHLMATNLTDELLVFVWYNMVVSASLVRSWECPVLPNLGTANSFCLGLK